MTSMSTDILIDVINTNIADNELFWAAGLIRETTAALWPVKHELHKEKNYEKDSRNKIF